MRGFNILNQLFVDTKHAMGTIHLAGCVLFFTHAKPTAPKARNPPEQFLNLPARKNLLHSVNNTA
jgi:hypothetical protein